MTSLLNEKDKKLTVDKVNSSVDDTITGQVRIDTHKHVSQWYMYFNDDSNRELTQTGEDTNLK